ncbi:MAG: hypothetical protein V4772_05725, partial [Pseudomonadota bacterium]
LSSAGDHNAGLTGIKVKLDDDGNLSKTKTVTTTNEKLTPALSDSNWLQRKFQQNIQRAAGNVIVEYAGKQYALVADYNFLFNDDLFNESNNYGFGKEIGGKIGIIQDPFGKPVYLGATSPIMGGAVDHLTLGADGMLYADVFMDEVSDQGSLMFKSLFVWNAAELIKEALAAQKRNQRLSIPIDRTSAQTAQTVAAQASRYDGADGKQEFGWTYGIGAYSVPGQYVSLGSPAKSPVITFGNIIQSAYDAVIAGLSFVSSPPPENSTTRALGIAPSEVDKQFEEAIRSGDVSALSP